MILIEIKVCSDCNDLWKLGGDFAYDLSDDDECDICSGLLYRNYENRAYLVEIKLNVLLCKIMNKVGGGK